MHSVRLANLAVKPCAVAASRADGASRGTSNQRGYDGDWQTFRRWFLHQPGNIFCRDCLTNVSSEVHHVQRLREHPETRLDPAACLALCGTCHKRRTRRGE
jgi:5-methylcytosine-specific restriction endonuclease McrA